MSRSNWIIGTVMLLIQGCQCCTPDNSTNIIDLNRNIEQEGLQSVFVADTIRVTVPSNWEQIKGEHFILREDCDNLFCGNMTCYLIPNIDQYTRLELGKLFVQNINSKYYNFKLIHSEVNTPDSSRMSFDYLLTDNELKLGGTTFIHIKGTVAIVYSFMGYNGENGDYVIFRGKITKVMGSIEYL